MLYFTIVSCCLAELKLLALSLQRVKNAAVWLIRGLSRRSHIAVALQELRWLQVKVPKLNGQYC